jgi:chemotaxis protein CheZ
MPVQRKVFRIEQMSAIAGPDVAIGTDCNPLQQDILVELKRLHELMERRGDASRAFDATPVVANELRQLKEETETIHGAINCTKREIASLHASTFNQTGRTRVERELDAVAEGTERAIKQILDSAEAIEEAASTLAASVTRGHEQALAQDIQDQVLRIFEACNVQDLSGQRITKVLATLKFVEERIANMMEIWGGAEAFRGLAVEVLAERKHAPVALHGPKLGGDPGHASQEDVDAIFAKELID